MAHMRWGEAGFDLIVYGKMPKRFESGEEALRYARQRSLKAFEVRENVYGIHVCVVSTKEDEDD